MNKIKVTVDYETPSTTKFDALIEQYLAAKAVTEQTEDTMIPLIKEGGQAKYEAICEQLYVIADQLKKISELRGGQHTEEASGTYFLNDDCYRMYVRYYPVRNEIAITYRERFGYTAWDFLDWENQSKDLLSLDGLVTNWNQFKIIEEMQRNCNWHLRCMIETQQKKAKTITETLNKIRE